MNQNYETKVHIFCNRIVALLLVILVVVVSSTNFSNSSTIFSSSLTITLIVYNLPFYRVSDSRLTVFVKAFFNHLHRNVEREKKIYFFQLF